MVDNDESASKTANRRTARYSWVLLLACSYEVFRLRCTHCGTDLRIIVGAACDLCVVHTESFGVATSVT